MSQAYGLHAVAALVENDPGRVRVIHVQRGRRDRRMAALVEAARAKGIRVETAERRWLDSRCPGSHQGVVADCHALRPLTDRDFVARFDALAAPRLLLALDGVTDPRNLGACLRSANAAGVQAVLLPRRRSAPLSDVTLKTAAGGAEGLMLVETANLARRLEWLKDQGIWVIGAAGEARMPWSDADLTGDCAIVIGGEGTGMRALTAKLCDQVVGIPMRGTVSSLNVSVATGVLLFEAVRQRGLATRPPPP